MKLVLVLALMLGFVWAVQPAAAETRVGSLKMAEVNGEVYCITGKSERGSTTLHRLTADGPEAVYSCPGRAWWLFEMNDRLLLVTEEQTFFESLMSLKEPLGTMAYRLVDPATGEAEILSGLTQWGICCRDDALVHMAGEAVGEKQTIWEERWEDGAWVRTFEWTGDQARMGYRSLSDFQEEHILLETVSCGYRLVDAKIYSRETQQVYELRGLPRDVPMTLQGGVLHSLHTDGLYAAVLETGERRLLLPLPEENRIDFAMNDRFIAVLEYGQVRVFDRETLACLHTVPLAEAARDWVLQEDRLYLFDPYAFAAVIDLTTGECQMAPFEY